MSPLVIVVLVTALIPISLGAFLVWFARPLAKFHAQWESRCTRLPGMKWSSQFMYGEQTSLTILRVLGVSFIVIGVLAPIFATILILAAQPK